MLLDTCSGYRARISTNRKRLEFNIQEIMKLIFKIRPLYYCTSARYPNLLVFTRADGSIEDLIVDTYTYHPHLHTAFIEYKDLIKKL